MAAPQRHFLAFGTDGRNVQSLKPGVIGHGKNPSKC
jgi:hypothetical protein